jgi:hypothetical protein
LIKHNPLYARLAELQFSDNHLEYA